MAKYLYPAIFTEEENGLYSVDFPDFEACFTQGSDLEDAFAMAHDILSLTLCDMEDDGTELPRPSDSRTFELGNGELTSLISADTTEYRKTYSGKAVKKTLTIPQWLNEAAMKENVNFSQVLQDALMVKLNVK